MQAADAMESLFVPYVFPSERYFIGLIGLLIVGLLVIRWYVSRKTKARPDS